MSVHRLPEAHYLHYVTLHLHSTYCNLFFIFLFSTYDVSFVKLVSFFFIHALKNFPLLLMWWFGLIME